MMWSTSSRKSTKSWHNDILGSALFLLVVLALHHYEQSYIAMDMILWSFAVSQRSVLTKCTFLKGQCLSLALDKQHAGLDMTRCVLPAFWETNNYMWSVKTRTLSTEDLVMLWGQCNLWLLLFHISVSLTSQKIPQNCGHRCGELHVAHPFSQLSLGFP